MKLLLPLAFAVALVPAVTATFQCYNMTIHDCSCNERNCDADKCGAIGGTWTDTCPGEKTCTCDNQDSYHAEVAVPAEERAEQCYDVFVHECSCTAANCDADKCTAT